MPANIWKTDRHALQRNAPVTGDDTPNSKRPTRKKRAGQGSRARRKKAAEALHPTARPPQQPEAEPEHILDDTSLSWQASASRPAPLSLSRRSSLGEGVDLLTTRAQQTLLGFLSEGEDGSLDDVELFDPMWGLTTPESRTATRMRARRPSAAEWQAVMEGKVPQRCLEEVFAGGVLALPLPTSPTSRPHTRSQSSTSTTSLESYVLSSSERTNNTSECMYTQNSNVSLNPLNPGTNRLRSRRPSASEWLDKHRKLTTDQHSSFDSASMLRAYAGVQNSVDCVAKQNVQRMSVESCSRDELQGLINERMRNRKKSACAEETAKRMTKNTKPTRFTTKWALPSSQRVMFNGSAQNIPPTPAPFSSEAATFSTQECSWGEPRVVRRGSITDRMLDFAGSFEPLRTPSGNTAMFPAQVYDAIFS